MKTSLIELFFPQFCLGCGYVGAYICPTCELKLNRVQTAHCFYCEKPSMFGFTHPRCRRDLGIDGCFSLFSYEGLFKKILQEAKYKGSYLVLQTLLSSFAIRSSPCLYQWKSLYNPFIMSVPLHKQRMRERGFNQSDQIVNTWFNPTWTPSDNLLMRKVNTDHLANIGNKKKRRTHIQGAFSYIGKTIPKTTMLVDDVITSGSTILECTKTLKERGIQTVLAFSLAKG